MLNLLTICDELIYHIRFRHIKIFVFRGYLYITRFLASKADTIIKNFRKGKI
nr:MAG TPA: hypothetical protein [Caudoviricetes sp.]